MMLIDTLSKFFPDGWSAADWEAVESRKRRPPIRHSRPVLGVAQRSVDAAID